MVFLTSAGLVLGRLVFACAFVVILLVPAWWVAGRLQDKEAAPFFRLLFAAGLALVGYISFVNLGGRLTHHSISVVLVYLLLNAAAGLFVWGRWRAEVDPSPLLATWRTWIGPVLIAIAIGFPQWVLAVSTNYFDEAASSAIHLTAANQFAEGLFPPRHNALPDIAIKYHYAFTILSGTVRWLSGLSANVSIDIVSTCLWLFIFLFVYFWLRKLDFGRLSSTWGAFATLLGGGLAWLYLPRIEVYNGIEKVPFPSELLHRFEPSKTWLDNLIAAGQVPSLHLRNADGSLSNLPWDVSAGFQQHAVSLGIALALIALYVFFTWQQRKDFHVPLLVVNIATFGVLFLGHGVFGTVAAVTAGLCLLGPWVRRPNLFRFYQGISFGTGVPIMAFLHGGLLARGKEYGTGTATTFRHGFGYPSGGFTGFIHWNIAGFGLPLLLAILAWAFHFWRRDSDHPERRLPFFALTVFAFVSWLAPQVMFYSSDTSGVEQFTEICKFFFAAHLALAVLSVFAVDRVLRSLHWSAVLPGFVAMAITPLAFVYAGSFTPEHRWLGFYTSPYYRNSIEQQMGETLRKLKKSNHDVYFDASADERKHGYLSEMLVFGGSVFTLTPSRYERTGVGYRLSEQVVAHRLVQNGRMARLLPGAAEDCACGWLYSRPFEDMALAPLIVRSRFAKLVSEGVMVNRFQAGARALYSIDKPTTDVDRGIDQYWRPRIVSQTSMTSSRTGGNDLIFFDYVDKKIFAGDRTIELPEWLKGELVQLYTGKFPGDTKVDFLFGRMQDTYFRLGKKIDDIIERSSWGWTYLNSNSNSWQPEYERWLWDWDIPLVADINHSGFDSHIAYRPRTGEWIIAPDGRLNGPKIDAAELPVPLAGRFLRGSAGDLGLWSLKTGMITLQSLSTGQTFTFKWGGRPGDVLVSGDYDGDGYDEIAVWQQTDRTWYWRHAPDGTISQATFGSATGIPIPADYNHDGRLDLAYWEPREQKIYVSYTQGRSVDLVIPVPPHTIPAFVNMY